MSTYASFPYYRGQGTQHPEAAASLPVSQRDALAAPEGYLADQGLVDACNVALLLGQPLLLTGEPGSGKTFFASSLAWELGLGAPLKFETKSESTARDLFYVYDAIRRFRDAQIGITDIRPVEYLSYNALGAAILRTTIPAESAALIPSNFKHQTPQRSVVLIDEIDKAPRDFPNDILNELENMFFRIPELNNVRVSAAPELYPIAVLTSNSEKDLPDPFLRRCIYYDIPFPDRDRLRTIVERRLSYLAFQDVFLDEALDLFFELRARGANLRKRPATAELLGWLIALRQLGGDSQNPLRDRESVRRSLSVLIKTAADQAHALQTIDQWLTQRS